MNRRHRETMEISDAVRLIQSTGYRMVLCITGGGAEAIAELLRHGGGSDSILEAIVPYCKASLEDLTGKTPSRYASPETAKQIAMSAYRRALYLDSKEVNHNPEMLLGIGVTSKLKKVMDERENREHEIHFAVQSYQRTAVSSLLLEKDLSREKQEKITSDFIIGKIARECMHNESAKTILPEYGIKGCINEKEADVDQSVSELLLKTFEDMNSPKKVEPLKVDMGINENETRIVFSGSFNPCHKNHVEMACIASDKYKYPVDFEMSLANVDKPPIDYISLRERMDSLLKYRTCRFMGNIYLTNTALFADKAILFPNSIFLIGTDTLNRLFNEKYYRGRENKQSLLEHFKRHNTRFMVFQRKDADVNMDIKIPDICEIVSLDDYNDDGTSSTAIREKYRE